jgi:hypothetical protein
VSEPSAFVFEMATEEPKRHKSPGIGQIPAKWIKAGSRSTCCEIHKLIDAIWNQEKLNEEWK